MAGTEALHLQAPIASVALSARGVSSEPVPLQTQPTSCGKVHAATLASSSGRTCVPACCFTGSWLLVGCLLFDKKLAP